MSFVLGAFYAKKEEEKERQALRDYFAAMALQGLYASPTVVRFADGTPAPQEMTNEMIAQIAYEQADAMMKARG